MANEIWTNYPSGNSLDAYVFRKTSDEVFDQADGGDTFEVWADGNVLNYDIPMTDNGGDYFTADFPSVITTAGVYRFAMSVRAGGTAAVGDRRIAQSEVYFDGTSEVDLLTLDTDIDVIDVNVDEILTIVQIQENIIDLNNA